MEVAILEQLLDDARDTLGITYKLIVADADASTQNAVEHHNVKLGRCCNHGGKNLGNQAIEVGKLKHCSCDGKLTAKGVAFKSGQKVHKNITIDMAKKMQRAFGAATVGAGTNGDMWVEDVHQIIAHYYGEHIKYTEVDVPDTDYDGWVRIDEFVGCKHHEVTTCFFAGEVAGKNVSGYKETESQGKRFDCPQMYTDLMKYIKDNLTCDKDMFITEVGAVRTNLVETVWKAGLKFRSKESNINGDRYIALSNIAHAYFNQPFLMDTYPDYCVQMELARLLGVTVSKEAEAAWRAQNAVRHKQHCIRKTPEYHRKVAVQLKARKQDARSDKAQFDQEKKDAQNPPAVYVSGNRFGADKDAEMREPAVASPSTKPGRVNLYGKKCECGSDTHATKRSKACELNPRNKKK
jgi:hypothetical protein